MSIKLKALLKSPWVFHLSTGSCNNCDIEILDCLTPRFDIERFGMLLVGSIKHADVLLITGSGNRKSMERAKRLYEQIPKPCLVVAIAPKFICTQAISASSLRKCFTSSQASSRCFVWALMGYITMSCSVGEVS